jgi:uncharacterized membrane-anchored protein
LLLKGRAALQKDELIQKNKEALTRLKQILMASGKSEQEIKEILEGD